MAARGWSDILTEIAAEVYVGISLLYLAFQIQKWRSGKPMNPPKLLLMAALVPLQWLAFEYATQFGPNGITRAGIALGLFHSLQYHRLMWFHNKNRYQAENALEKHGLTAVLGQKFGYYFAVAVGLYWFVDLLPQALFPMQWLVAALWGGFLHALPAGFKDLEGPG